MGPRPGAGAVLESHHESAFADRRAPTTDADTDAEIDTAADADADAEYFGLSGIAISWRGMIAQHSGHSPAPVAILALSICLGCGSGKSSDRREDTPKPQPEPESRRSLSLKQMTPKRKVTDFQKPPPLPRLEPVELLEPGAKPRQSLRYRLDDKPHEYTIRATLKTRTLTRGKWNETMVLPEVMIGLATRRSGQDNALWVLDVRGLEAHIANPANAAGDAAPDPARAALDNLLTRYRSYLERRRAQLPLTDRGRPGKPALTPDARRSPDARHIQAEMTQLLVESIVPLPEEPVGKGARWRAVTILYRGRSVVKQKAEYKLLSAPKGRMRLDARITQIGEQQLLEAPELPRGQTAELVALFWQLAGEIALDPTLPTPVAGTMTSELRVHGRIIGHQGTQDYSFETTGQVVLETSTQDSERESM